MSWVFLVGAVLLVSLVAMRILSELVARRARARKGLQWTDNSPRRPDNTIER